jgi:hypothetical protein
MAETRSLVPVQMLNVLTSLFAISPHFPAMGQTCIRESSQTLADRNNPSINYYYQGAPILDVPSGLGPRISST